MPVVYLEGLQVFGSFDTSHATSCLSRAVAEVLGQSQNVNVFCYPVEDSISASCVLNFTVDHNLCKGCILGVDYFARIFPDLCELFDIIIYPQDPSSTASYLPPPIEEFVFYSLVLQSRP
jgi:hypothetical protein